MSLGKQIEQELAHSVMKIYYETIEIKTVRSYHSNRKKGYVVEDKMVKQRWHC